MGRIDVRGVDDEVIAEFKSFVLKKYGKLHTVFGLEVEKALRHYLEAQRGEAPPRAQKSEHTHAATDTNTGAARRPSEDVEKLKEEVLKQVEPGGTVPKEVLRQMVVRSCGVIDRRAIDDRIRTLTAKGIIEPAWDLSRKGNVFRVVGDEKR